MKLTDRFVKTAVLPEGRTDVVFWDEETSGLGLRIRQSGARSLLYRYRVGGKQRVITFDTATAIATVKKTVGDLAAKVRLGHDPANDRTIGRQNAGNVFVKLAEKYLNAHRSEWRGRSAQNVERHLLQYAKPLHDMPITSIELADIARLLNTIAKTSGAPSANRCRSSLSAMFTWVRQQGHKLPAENPVTDSERRDEVSRERVLSDAELRVIWLACDDGDFGRAVRLLTLTGARTGEIGGLRWSEIQDDRIAIPRQRIKNHHDHEIALTPAIKALLPERTERENLFGRTEHGFRGWPASKKVLDARIAKMTGKALAHWTLHDLRRTFSTTLARLGVAPIVIEAALNHRKADVASTYNRHSYCDERRAALELLAAHIARIVTGN